MRQRRRLLGSMAFLLSAWLIGILPARGELSCSFRFDGFGNWSLDAADVLDDIEVIVPPGSEVVKAFLYCGTALGEPAIPGETPRVTINGTTYGPTEFVPLTFVPFPNRPDMGMQAYRADATAQIAAEVGSGSDIPFTFTVESDSTPLGRTTGEILAVIYSNPAEHERSITFYDGGMLTTGDSFAVDFHEPLDTTIPGFGALFSLGIGFSSAWTQYTIVDVNGRRLSGAAGGDDDGIRTITVGGIGDSPTNPPDPFITDRPRPRDDDELYDLARGNDVDPSPFIDDGCQSFFVSTFNESDDDHLFFAGVNVVTQFNGSCQPEEEASNLRLTKSCNGILFTSDESLNDPCDHHYDLHGATAPDSWSGFESNVIYSGGDTTFQEPVEYLYYLVVPMGPGGEGGPVGHFSI